MARECARGAFAARWEVLLLVLAALCFLAGHGRMPRIGRAFVPGDRAAGTYRVVTWNVGGGLAQGAPALDDADLAHVTAVLSELDPELCFLQEVRDAGQVRDLARGLGAGWSSLTSGGGSGGGGRRVAVLARGGRLERVPLPSPGQRVVAVRHAAGEAPAVLAAGLHADAFSARRRNELIGGTLEALLELGAPGGCILAGDFNLDLDLDKRGDLFTDDEHADVETYNYVAERLRDAARGRGSTAQPDRRLDYVFVSPQLAVRAAGPVRGRRTAAMDHDPVVADLERPRP